MQWSISKRPTTLNALYGLNNIKKFFYTKMRSDDWPKSILLRGQFGTGKTTVAKIISQMMVCQNPTPEGDPCGECASCRSIKDEKWDRDVIQIDGGQAGKAEVIDIIKETIATPPFRDKRKVVIIEEVQELSKAAQNSLLKILEMPRKNIHFILLSMQFGNLSGFVSRCIPFNFQQFTVKDIMMFEKSILESEGLWDGDDLPKDFKLKGLATIAQVSGGSLRQALQLLETCITGEFFTSDEIRENLGVADESEIQDILLEILNGQNTRIWDQVKKHTPSDFFALGYKIVSDAVLYKKTGYLEFDERHFFSKNTMRLASSPSIYLLAEAMRGISVAAKGYLRAADLLLPLVDVFTKAETVNQPNTNSSRPARATRATRPTKLRS